MSRTNTRTPTLQTQFARVVLAALLAITPRAGHAAPAKVGSVRTPAAEAVALFEEGTVLEREGDKKAAADRYRAAAEANGALYEAEDPASAAHATFVARTIKGYDAAFKLSDRPALNRSASDWCTKILAEKAEDPTSAKIAEKCAQWGWQPPLETAEPPGPSEPPGPLGLDLAATENDGQRETGAEAGTETLHTDDRGATPPPSPPSPSKPWRGLAIAGGSTLAGGTILLVLALAGAVRQRSIMQEDDDCTLPYDDRCDKLINTGQALRPLSAASAIAGTLLTGTGAALLTIAMRRRAEKVTLAPALHSQVIGLTLRGRF